MANLDGDAERQVHARKTRVAQVVHAVNFDDINVLRVQPVARPGGFKSEPVAAVLETVIAIIAFADTKAVFASEIGLVTVGRNAAGSGMLFVLCGLALLLRVFLFRLSILLFLLGLCRLCLFPLGAFLLGVCTSGLADFSGCAAFSFSCAGLSLLSSCCSCCSCAYAGMPIPRDKERTAVLIAPTSFIKCCLHYRIAVYSRLTASFLWLH
jgi:hypothetical protein